MRIPAIKQSDLLYVLESEYEDTFHLFNLIVAWSLCKAREECRDRITNTNELYQILKLLGEERPSDCIRELILRGFFVEPVEGSVSTNPNVSEIQWKPIPWTDPFANETQK